jgi:Heparinase II/III-like protein/Heparinase II/III N-terminus
MAGLERGLGWYLRRLAVMRPGEIAHRVAEQARLQRLRLRHRAGARWPAVGAVARFGFCRATTPRLPALDWDLEALRHDADALLAAAPGALGYAWRWQDAPGVWRVAPDTGRLWPAGFFGAIDYRAGNPSGDARVVWEPARLQWLVGLALLTRHGAPAERELARQRFAAVFASWHAQNPPCDGIHYVAAMECALRVIACCHACDIARPVLPGDSPVWRLLAELVAGHAALVLERLSLHSSAGNHTIAEAAGLVHAGVLFPELAGASHWREQGLALLTAEARRQVLPDGGGIEQATGYGGFVCELMALTIAVLDANELPVPAELRDAAVRSAAFLRALAGPEGRLPISGDYDGGRALAPWLRPVWSTPAYRHAPGITTFAASGCSILQTEGAAGWRVFLDHGPLGMPPACGHGHADALSLSLRVRGQDVLIDPGTYTYTGDAAWRRYFRSTAAHNTVTVGGADQSRQLAAFLWSDAAAGALVRSESTAGVHRILVRHDGYRRRFGVRHWRGAVLREGGGLVVWDWLDGAGEVPVELWWHGAATAELEGSRCRLPGKLTLEVRGAQAVGCRIGSGSPVGGWQSPQYGRKVPAATLCARWSGALPREMLTCVDSDPRQVTDAMIEADVDVFRRWTR